MKSYTILKDGSISRTLTCRESSLADQLNDGETAIEGRFPSNLYKIEGGVPIALPSEGKTSGNRQLEDKVPLRFLIRSLKAIRRDLREGGTENLNQLIQKLENHD